MVMATWPQLDPCLMNSVMLGARLVAELFPPNPITRAISMADLPPGEEVNLIILLIDLNVLSLKNSSQLLTEANKQKSEDSTCKILQKLVHKYFIVFELKVQVTHCHFSPQ